MCPKCREPLIVVEYEGVEVDHCPDCRGTWFDAGELELVTELAGVAPARLVAALRSDVGLKRSTRRCPRCRRRMRTFTVGQSPSIELDRCPAGHGIWLDAGELAAVVRAFAPRDDAGVARFLGELFRHELTGQAEES